MDKKRFNSHCAFSGVSGAFFVFLPFDEIKIRQGEGLALIGESGCGKSSLLRIISGLMLKNLYGKDFQADIVWQNKLTPVQEEFV